MSIILTRPPGISGSSSPFTMLEGSGHSYMYGLSATGGHGYLAKLGQILGLSGGNYINRGNGGAMLTSDNQSPVGNGWQYNLQQLPRASGGSPWLPASSLYVINFGFIDIANLGVGPAAITQIKSALRTVISRIRASATGVYPNTDASVVYGGSGGTHWSTSGAAGIGSGSSIAYTSTNLDTVTITLPASFPGGTVALGYTAGAGWGAINTVTVDGAAAGVLDTHSLAPVIAGKGGIAVNTNGAVQRLTGLAAGAHTIVDTVTGITGFTYFNYWQVEAPDPPTVLLVLQPRLTAAGYAVFSGYAFPPNDTAVQALNVAQRQVAAEFDSSVIPVTVDALINAQASMYSPTGGDQEHPSDLGHSTIAAALLRAAQPGPWLPQLATAN